MATLDSCCMRHSVHKGHVPAGDARGCAAPLQDRRCLILLLAVGAGAIEPCRAPADALRAGYEQVEAGLFEDHPKQHALCNLLIGLRTLTPVSMAAASCASMPNRFHLHSAICVPHQ